MNGTFPPPPERAGPAATAGELGAAVRQAIEQSLTARLWQIDRQLEAIGRRLAPPVRAYERGPLPMTALLSAIVVLAALATLGAKLVSDRAYSNGVAAGYARAAIYESHHPPQWRAYQRAILSAGRGEMLRARRG